MAKLELGGVERRATESELGVPVSRSGQSAPSVGCVTEERVTYVGQMDADLVGSTGLDGHAHPARELEPLSYVDVADRRLSAGHP